MIRAKNLVNPLRKVKSKLRFQNDEGDWQEETVTVYYNSPTVKMWRETFGDLPTDGNQTEIEKEQSRKTLADSMMKLVNSIPEIVDDMNQPIELTLEFFENLSFENLKQLNEDIAADIDPKKFRSATTPVG
jgi:hypothetical protein